MKTLGSLFSGIGGIDLAFTAAGFDVRWQVEIDAWCRTVLAHHWPRAERYADVTTIEAGQLSHVDVIAAGFPCQPFSLAGKQAGMADERFLVPAMLEVIRDVRPSIVFLENVPGFASLDDGNAFKLLLRALAEIGYDAEWNHLRAADAGAGHVRERWFLVAHRNDRHGAEPAAFENRVQNKVRHMASQNARRSELIYAAGSGREAMAYAYRNHSQKQASTEKRASSRIPAGYRSSRAYLVNTSSPRLQGRNAPARQRKLGFYSRRSEALRAYRLSQSRMGRGAHGLSAGLDRHRWPAPPGPQHAWEPPRVLPESAPQMRHRLQALGNAVVPQVIVPVAQAIAEWLDMQSEQGSKAA